MADRLSALGAAGSGILIYAIWILVLVDVLARQSGYPIAMLFDITMIALIWQPFLGLAETHRQRAHVSMDLLLDILRPRTQTLVKVGLEILVLAGLFILLWSAFQQVRVSATYGARIVGTGIPVYVPQLALVVGAVLFIFQSLRHLFRLVASARNGG